MDNFLTIVGVIFLCCLPIAFYFFIIIYTTLEKILDETHCMKCDIKLFLNWFDKYRKEV